MSEEENTPLDYNEVLPDSENEPQNPVNKKLAFYLELIPLAILILAYCLKYLGYASWWAIFSIGAVMACLNYLVISWFFFKPDYNSWLEKLVTVAFAFFFALGIGSIFLRKNNWEKADELSHLALSGTGFLFVFSGLMLLWNFRNEQVSRFYRLTLARLLILLVILLKLMQ